MEDCCSQRFSVLFFFSQAKLSAIKPSQHSHPLKAGPPPHSAKRHGVVRVVVTISPKLSLTLRSEAYGARYTRQLGS